MNPEIQPKKSIRSFLPSVLSGVIGWVVVPVALVLILHNFVFQAFHVVGTSMIPTLKNSDYLVVSKVEDTVAHAAAPKDQNSYIPRRGEVIVFHFPKVPAEVFVKRVIALPGERVVVKDGSVTVYSSQNPAGFMPDNGSYRVANSITEGTFDDVIPPGNVFVMGDNRLPGGSYDSRTWGPLPTHYIIGRAILRLLPLDQFRFFR